MLFRLTVKAQRQTLRVQKKTFGTHPVQIRLTVKAHRENAQDIKQGAYANPPNSQGTTSKHPGKKPCAKLPLPIRLTVKAQRQKMRV